MIDEIILGEDLIEFYKVINKYKKYGNNVEKFVKALPQLLNNYKQKYLIKDYKLLKGGRLGLIFCGYSMKYNKEIVFKIIPDFLNVFEIEANAYKKISNKYMCPTYEIDYKNSVIVMDKLNTSKTLKYMEDKLETEKFFDKVYSNSIKCNDNKKIYYLQILKNYFNELGNVNINNFEYLKKSVIDVYNKHFNNDELYLIHGDLHSKNIMKNDNDYYSIDPLGYIAPIEFTFARFIITELFFTNNSEEYFNELINFISKYANREKLINAVYIDSMLFLSALLLQIEDYNKYLSKVMDIIKLIEKSKKEMEMNENEKNCYNITKTRKLVFRS